MAAVWLWQVIALKLDKMEKTFGDLKELLTFFVKEYHERGLCSIIAKLSFCACIYFLWEHTNNVVFHEAKQSKMQILRNVEHMVKLNLMGRGFKENDNPGSRLIVAWWDLFCRSFIFLRWEMFLVGLFVHATFY